MDKNTKIKDLETLLQESRIEEEIQSILEELEANDAPEAIENGAPTEIEGDASREEYMPDEEEADDVEEVVVESSMQEDVNISTGAITLGGGRNKHFTRGDTTKTTDLKNDLKAEVKPSLTAEVNPSVAAEVNPNVKADVKADVDAKDAAVSVGAGKANSNLQKKSRNESVEYTSLTEAKPTPTPTPPTPPKDWDDMTAEEKKKANKDKYLAELEIESEKRKAEADIEKRKADSEKEARLKSETEKMTAEADKRKAEADKAKAEADKETAKKYARGKEAIEIKDARREALGRTGAAAAEIAGGIGTAHATASHAVASKNFTLGHGAGALVGGALIAKGVVDAVKAHKAKKKRKELEDASSETYIDGNRDYTDDGSGNSDVDKVKKRLKESVLSDYELMQILDECDYIPSMENVQILREMNFLTEEELTLFTEEDLNVLSEGLFGAMRGVRVANTMGSAVQAGAKRDLVGAKETQAANKASVKMDALQKKIDKTTDDTKKEKLMGKKAKIEEKDAARTEKNTIKMKALEDKQKVMQAKAKLIASRGVGKSKGHQTSMNNVIKARNTASAATGENLKNIQNQDLNASTLWTDYELMQLLDECGYIGSLENLLILKEDESLLLELCEEVLDKNPEHENAEDEGFKDGEADDEAMPKHEHKFENGVCEICGKKEDDKALDEAFNNIFNILSEEFDVNDAPKAIDSTESDEISAEFDEEDYLTDEEEADDVEEVVVESFSDYELMQILDEAGYETTIENVQILRENNELLNEIFDRSKGKKQARTEIAIRKITKQIEKLKNDKTPDEKQPELKKLEKKLEKLQTAYDASHERYVKSSDKKQKRYKEGYDKVIGAYTKEEARRIEANDRMKNAKKDFSAQPVYNESANLVESFSDYELMQILDEAGYETTIENVQILRERAEYIANYILTEEVTEDEKKKAHEIVDAENKERRKKKGHVVKAIAKGAIAAGLLGGAGWLATKHGAAEAANIKNLSKTADVANQSIEAAKATNVGLEKIVADTSVDAQAANKAVADAAANSATVDSSLIKAADTANAAHANAAQNLQKGKEALKAAEDNLKNVTKNINKAKAKALVKQAAKVGVTGAGTAVAVGSAVHSVKKAKNLKEAFDFGYRYYENSANKEVLVEQVALTIASENKDRLFVEMVNATILANKLRNELLEKYSDSSLERVNTILEELAANDTPDAIKANGYSEEVADFEREDFMIDEEEADDVKEIVIETYISTEDVKDMLREYGFEANENNVNFLKEELAINDSPVVIKIKDADEIKANFVKVDYFPEEIMSDDINGEVEAEHFKGNPEFARKDYMVDEVEVEDVKEIVVESIKKYAKDKIEKIIKTNC